MNATLTPRATAEKSRAIPNVADLQTALRKYCLSLTDSEWEAEDLAQDAWLKALDGSRLSVHPNSEAYLLRIAKNAWIDRVRRGAKLSAILKSERPEATEASVGALEIESAFHALLKHLPALQRAVFLLRDVFGFSSSEAAEMLRITEGAAKAALHRARHNLPRVREHLEHGGPPSDEEPGLKAYLKAIAFAYESGDIASVLELVRRIEDEPAAAIGMLHARRLWTSTVRRTEEPLGNAPLFSLAA